MTKNTKTKSEVSAVSWSDKAIGSLARALINEMIRFDVGKEDQKRVVMEMLKRLSR